MNIVTFFDEVCTFDLVNAARCDSLGMQSLSAFHYISDTRIISIGKAGMSPGAAIINMNLVPDTPTANWNKVFNIPTGATAYLGSGSITTNTDKSHVYVAYPTGPSAASKYLYFAVLNEATGGLVGDSQASDTIVTIVNEAYFYDGKVYLLVEATQHSLFVYDTSSGSFTSMIETTTSSYLSIHSSSISGR